MTEEIQKMNIKLSSQLLWLTISFGILFVIFAYFILLEKAYVLSSKSLVPFVITIVFTFGILFYHYYAEKRLVLNINDKEKELQEVQTMMKTDKDILMTFPLLLLALGILLRDEVPCGTCENGFLKTKHKLVTNLFLLAILFGLIFPFLIDTLVIDYENLERLLLLENLEFISISYGFGIIVLLLTVVFMNNR